MSERQHLGPLEGSQNPKFIDWEMECLSLRAENERLREALRFLVEGTKWKSVDKDNMEFEGRVTCYQLDQARAALKDAPK